MVVFVGTPQFMRIALWVAIETMHLDIARISFFLGTIFCSVYLPHDAVGWSEV